LSNTLIFVFGTAIFSTVLGAFLAYLSVRTDIPLKGLFGFLPIVPMMIPHVLFSSAWITLLNPTNGMFNVMLRNLFGLASGPFNIYSLGGMIFLEGMLDLPVTYLVMAPAMVSFDTKLEEAAKVSSKRRFQLSHLAHRYAACVETCDFSHFYLGYYPQSGFLCCPPHGGGAGTDLCPNYTHSPNHLYRLVP